MGLFLASKLTRLALGAAQTALAAGEACRTGKKIEKRVREALRPQKEDVITMKKSTFAAILVFFAAIAGALTAAYMYLRRREAELDEYEQLLFSEDFSHEEPAAEETAAATALRTEPHAPAGAVVTPFFRNTLSLMPRSTQRNASSACTHPAAYALSYSTKEWDKI